MRRDLKDKEMWDISGTWVRGGAVLGEWLDLMILQVFSSLNDSVLFSVPRVGYR